MSAKASGARPNGTPDGDSKHRTHHDGSSTRAFTVEQKAEVIRIRRCGHTEFYKILNIEKESNDGQIKKAYRKLSLLTHPDKNGYEGADEAFKMVSRAFQILSDSDKKARYDRFGGDPDSRFQSSASATGASPFSGFSQRTGAGGRAGPMFEEEISPEELFRQFFGGGMGGMGPFGSTFGGPGFVFNLGGGPGIRVHQFGGDIPRARPHNHDGSQNSSPLAVLQGLLPLLLLFVLPLLSSLFGGTSGPTGPSFRFDGPVKPYTDLRTSGRLGIQYFVNPKDVSDFTPKLWTELDQKAEGQYLHKLSAACDVELQHRQRLAQEAQGFFFTDMEKLERARNMEMKNCDKLKSHGYSVGYQ